MSIVKSLTKKNCKEIGAEHVGKNQLGGIDYSYRGILFNQETPRNGVVYISLLFGESFKSIVANNIFRQIFQGETDVRHETEFDLSELKSWMDSIADAAEEAEKQAQAPFSEEEAKSAVAELEGKKQITLQVVEQVKKTFAWWGNRYATSDAIDKISKVEKACQEAEISFVALEAQETPLAKRELIRVWRRLLDSVDYELSKLKQLL